MFSPQKKKKQLNEVMEVFTKPVVVISQYKSTFFLLNLKGPHETSNQQVVRLPFSLTFQRVKSSSTLAHSCHCDFHFPVS